MTQHLRSTAWIVLGVLVGVLLFAARTAVHALPEYTARTGEPCSACHVNPAGGGPRTPQGTLWIAQGRPDQVPALPGSEPVEEPAAPDPQGQALYEELACAACHGPSGEGASGPPLNIQLPADQIAQVTRNGQGTMMAYPEDRLSDDDLEILVEFVQFLAEGSAQTAVAPEQPGLPPAILACGDPAADSPRSDCGGN